ncbi:phosphoglycolate phosphatase [Allostella sp. ATCC 35155]|nr:phosphoglycolate phosphatase [Stella sp. ATCC 35155]
MTSHTVLLDLDGTLTDSRPGIVACYHAALRSLGHEPDPAIDLTFVIGPPPEEIMPQVLARYGDDRSLEAVALYREHYAQGGLFQNSVYDGIPEALAALAEAGCVLYVATAKRTVFARRILDHFGLSPAFRRIYGSEPGGALDRKGDLIAHILANEPIAPEGTIMVGDRHHDISGARQNGLPAIGVAWGYGGPEELERAGADRIAGSPADLAAAVSYLRRT